ncbi:hypothetical protein H6M51_05160 [Rhizobium sp. AQ_MP]|uniref:hypothetical protein n=1 Tax=Rhizobium sp. AQ_MP TaxID=2761536 RepID=UPI00163A192F|nr:hypothetical protein [Rhizobium sp. AQ_MP]MBC2772239.1 hypothetical protein [Rhizobium sp. AQ_MP]
MRLALNVHPGSSEAFAGAGPSDASLRIEMKQLQQAGRLADKLVLAGGGGHNSLLFLFYLGYPKIRLGRSGNHCGPIGIQN